MKAYLTTQKGRFTWSGHNASGNPAHAPYALVIDIGRDFILTTGDKLYLTGPGPQQFQSFSPEGVVLAARGGMFGFKLSEADEIGPRRKDRGEQRRRKLGRRGRIAEDLEARK